jgi:P22 coat protein - gene protein 5
MPNNFFTLPEISQEIIRLVENELVLGKSVGTDKLENETVKSGGEVRIRRQMQYLGQDNNLDLTSFAEDVIEGTLSVKLDQTWSGKVTLGALDRTLSFDRYSDMILKPMARRAAERIEGSIAALYPAFYWFDGTPGTLPSTFSALADAGAIFTDGGNSTSGRLAFHSPATAAKLAATIQGTYVDGNNKKALEMAKVGRYGNFDNYETVFAPTHTVGVAGGTPTVNGAAQNVTYNTAKDTWSQTLITTAWTASTTGVLRAGDVFQIAGVFAVNPNTKASTGRLQTFTVLLDANSGAAGATTVTISPPIITSGAFQTVTAAPANGAAITLRTGTPGVAYRQSLLLDPMAIALVSRPLDIPQGEGVSTSTKSGEFVTLSTTKWVDGNTLNENMRFDMLWKPVVMDPRRGMRLTN